MSKGIFFRLILLCALFHHTGTRAQSGSNMIGQFPELYAAADPENCPLFSLVVNGTQVSSDQFEPAGEMFFLHNGLNLRAELSGPIPGKGYSYMTIRFLNRSGDTLELENVVPLGMSRNRLYITGHGQPGLTRATLFQPGKGPVGLIVPDNAWELGYTSLQLTPDSGMALLARRVSWENALRRRYSTVLYPGGEVTYRIYAENYAGDWRSGMELVFRERWLFDLDTFDNDLYERQDLQWIREDYLAVLQFAWDRDFYSPGTQSYAPFRDFFHRYDNLHGGYDIYGIWQGWPRLGLDQRNQWDLFRDLPGGIDSLGALSDYCRDNSSAFFISFNPWDESTRKVDHLEEMTGIIRDTRADGVVLDTRGSSSAALQQAADRAKPGVVMYSEGMAVAQDMPGIISGRVHNAILMSPPLNLNRLIKPDFQVFRVLDLRDGRLRREMAICLFNGYGAELNLFSPAHPWWVEEEYAFMGRCLMIMRQNSKAFHDPHWIPLVESPDSIWVNEWRHGDKLLYTILSLKPEGHAGPLLKGPTNPLLKGPTSPLLKGPTSPLLKVPTSPLLDVRNKELHWVSLWDHEEITPHETRIEPFAQDLSGTRSEGSVQVIAGFPELLKVELSARTIAVSAPEGDRVLVWKGDPSYANRNRGEFSLESSDPGNRPGIEIPLPDWMHLPEGKLVIQLFQGDELLDERVLHTGMATPVRISSTHRTPSRRRAPQGMVEVQGAPFLFYRGSDADFVPYPSNYDSLRADPGTFYMDRYPVTNRQFHEFIQATGYQPDDTANFVSHWTEGSFPDSLARHPVVWVSLEDARAYARWKGMRLPSEMEWQYAAQGTDGRRWPWGERFDSTACNVGNGHTTPVNAFPNGSSPFGVEDMVGNVWQLCNDEYTNGSFTFSMIRGGSFYEPTSSWWYVLGGPQPNDRTQMLLRTSPGFDRSATVGFRCVCDK